MFADNRDMIETEADKIRIIAQAAQNLPPHTQRTLDLSVFVGHLPNRESATVAAYAVQLALRYKGGLAVSLINCTVVSPDFLYAFLRKLWTDLKPNDFRRVELWGLSEREAQMADRAMARIKGAG